MRALPILVLVMSATMADAKPSRETAKSHIDKATKAHKDGKFELALTELQAAYALEPQPKLLFAIAQVHAKLGDCDNAIDNYNRFLAATKDKSKHAVVKQAIAACKPRIEPAPPTPPVEAEPPPPVPEPVVEPAPPPPPPVIASKPTPAPVATITTKRPFYRDVLGDVLVVGGVALGVVAFIQYRGALSDLDEAERADNINAYNDLVGSARDQRTISLVLAGGGVMLVAAGVWRFAVSGGGETRTTVAVVPTVSGGLVTWSGGF